MKKIALIQDYFFQFGGAEKVVEKWAEMYPEADIYTSFFVPEKFQDSPLLLKAWIKGRIHTTWLQYLFSITFIRRFQKHLFWIYPIVMSFVVVRNYDVVLISSTYCAKNVRFANCSKIIHYCHSPTRYLYGLVQETDLKTISPMLRKLIPLFTFWLRWLDMRAVKYLVRKGTIWIGNSKFIQKTIKDVYHVDAGVIYPPIEMNRFSSVQRTGQTLSDYYFYFGRITFHKKVELVVEACLKLGRKVKIAGLSAFQPEMDKLHEIVEEHEAQHPEHKGYVEFIEQRISDDEIKHYLSECKAFLFPAKEDSGMIPVEVLSSGTPVIAYAAGGALEYVQDKRNGILFSPQTTDGLAKAMLDFENITDWDTQIIKDSAKPFAEETFIRQFNELVDKVS